MICSWDIECDRLKLAITGYLPPSPHLKTQKIRIPKKWKELLEVSSFYTIAPKKQNHMRYSSSDMEWDRHNCLSFWAIFCLYTPLTTRKIKILQQWKKHLEMSSFKYVYQKSLSSWDVIPLHMCTRNHHHMNDVCFLRYGIQHT